MRYNQAKLDVELEYASLKEGQSESGICPSCNGGPTKERSFSVSRSRGALLYCCHRASCKFNGAIILTSAASRATRGSETPRSRTYIPSTQLDEEHVELLVEKFGLTRTSIEFAGLRWIEANAGVYSRRICMPIYGPNLRERGASYRSYEGGNPKSLIRFHDSDAIALAWYISKRKSKAVVLVEDQISAIKLSPYYDSAALLSTNLSMAKVKEIRERKYEKVFLCLDNDATSVAVQLAVSLKYKLPGLQIIGLEKDVKNMNEEEMDSFLKRLEN